MPLDERQERIKALDIAVGQIEKQFGKGSIMRLGQNKAVAPVDVISTGALSIDYALGIGGVPRGRVIEIFGPESSGKTTLALQVIAEAQKTGGLAAFVDSVEDTILTINDRIRAHSAAHFGGRTMGCTVVNPPVNPPVDPGGPCTGPDCPSCNRI